LDQALADAVAAIHDGRVGDSSGVEVDVAEVVELGEREAAGLSPHGQELKDVRQRRFGQRALDRHQRTSSMSRAATSGKCHTIFSWSRQYVSAGSCDGTVGAPRSCPAADSAGCTCCTCCAITEATSLTKAWNSSAVMRAH